MPPRASLRQRAATPARSARGNTAALQDTPSGKRSTRAASRQPLATQDVVSNPALPQVQTRQSYAYGSSKTPALPEQLHARDMSMRAVANRLNNAADEAERNFEAQAAEVRGNTPDSPTSAREARAQRRASKEPVRSPPSETPDEVRKKNRVAAWVDSSQLDDITEEDSRQPKTPDRDREGSLPSSFPTGSFNHSYNYERGEREPRLPQPESEPQTEPQIPPQPPHQPQEAEQLARQPSVIRPKPPSLVSRTKARIRQASTTFSNAIKHTASTLWQWMSRMLHNFQKSLLELPESPAISALFKTITAVAILSLVTYLSCTIFTYTCDASSTSIITQSLQTVCGQCRTASSTLTLPTNFNLTGTNSADLASLLRTLQNTQSRLNQMESRLNSRIDSSHASHTADALALRSQQEALQVQIGQLTDQHSSIDPSAGQQSIHNGISSPLIGKINFFSPSSGAVILPHLTSPTRAHRHSLPVEILKRLIGAKKTLSPPPITALEPWSDEGDCWCAAETPLTSAYAVQSRGVQGDERAMDSSQDSIRLAIQTSQPIYPTELIIEHFPTAASLTPGTAPKDIELWADFSDLSYEQWESLHIKDLISESPVQSFLPLADPQRGGKTWALIGTATYAATVHNPHTSSTSDDDNDDEAQHEFEMSANEPLTLNAKRRRESRNRGMGPSGARKPEPHVQSFNLSINQNGLLHYSDRFLVRVRRNYGGAYTCLYRVRLHGVPVGEGGMEG